MSPSVAIVIVNYKGREDTLECLESLAHLTYPNVTVVLVDNASDDGTPEAVRNAFPVVQVIESATNVGFAGGNNRGIRHALDRGADYCFLLNNDTTVEPGMLEPLIAYAESDSTTGVIGPIMCYYSAPETIWATGGAMNARADSRLVQEGESVSAAGSDPVVRDFIIGCGMLVPRRIWEQVGLFDERYFLYYEESDLCFRVRAAGFRCVFHPGSRLWHKVSRSTGATSELTLYYMRRNALLFLEKNGTREGRLSLLIDAARLTVVWTLQRNSRRAGVLAWAIGDYFFRRFGKARHVFR